ncbi:MAG TPA: RNA polymerase-associated protein RapA [Gammaproteobacteria bacterium]|nr:RNA polymerase-associated protein RapA [Gammaproteobacteria bacterium]
MKQSLEFKPGQRWICDADLALGLGRVQSTDARTVTVVFGASGVTRSFAIREAPLTRVTFGVGDVAPDRSGAVFTIESVRMVDGLLTYAARDADGGLRALPESELADSIRLNRPLDRLLSGSIDPDKWFRLRHLTRRHLARISRQGLHGLVGTRTSLIPHQLYIAHEVGRRHAPRVMLADEVGLGKTIEAGLILHHQLIAERAGRAMIVAPENLLHQWLLEMLRRFNLHFTLLDEARCAEDPDAGGGENPFLCAQLILCGREFLRHNPERLTQAVTARFDLLIVDEAHHLHWSPEGASPDYAAIERLAGHCKGLLLLTATPEQFGRESHFARLRLLDPQRFADYSAFEREQLNYARVAAAINNLLEGRPVDETDRAQFAGFLGDHSSVIPASSVDREQFIGQLVDRHGTGRILFRNTRAAVGGFPDRSVHVHELAAPAQYLEPLALAAESSDDFQPLLAPEHAYRRMTGNAPEWMRIDPRVEWLTKFLKGRRREKTLVIAATAATARELSQCLVQRHGIAAADFHEGMSLLERDRAGAYFAEGEAGAQALVCSEIGSEGRNFQFARNLVLFDLPLNPDLLEQRIGRLDRIGQQGTIQIHLPLLLNTPQTLVYRWHQEGLDAFAQTCPAGYAVYEVFEQELKRMLRTAAAAVVDPGDLIGRAAGLREELNAALRQGRDRLLEYNSCRPELAADLRRRALELDADASLRDYLDLAFDCHGVDSEDLGGEGLLLAPTYRMTRPFPGLPEEGLTVTLNRAAALAHEDWGFLTWEHPMVINAMDIAIGGESGNAAVSAIKDRRLKPGALYLELVYVLHFGNRSADVPSEYLQAESLDLILDEQGEPVASLDHEHINRAIIPIPAEVAKQVVDLKEDSIRELLAIGERLAAQRFAPILAEIRLRAEESLRHEEDRLCTLQRVNPNVREEEIQFFARRRKDLAADFVSAGPHLDAARIIITT